MSKKKINIFASFLAVVFAFAIINIPYTYAKNTNMEKQIEITGKNSNTDTDILSLINNYQEQYFTIIKRNNVFLNQENNKALNNDRKELKKLFNKVKRQITNKNYLKEYKEIEKRYSKCEEETTIGINEFAEKNYNEIDNLLNTVYKEVKSKISSDDFQKLVLSERKWLKDVKSYEKIYESMDFGTIETSIYYEYQINMRNFRTLLLMMYL